MRPSMGSVGDAQGNAMCKNFFAALECELLDRTTFKTQTETRMTVFELSKASITRINVTPASITNRRCTPSRLC
jgi:transposase InsO family protein